MKLVELDPDVIEWEDWAKRSLLDEFFVDELARSIREHGQATPIRVRVVNGRYVGVSGYQRWLACRKAGVKVRAEVIDLDDRAAVLSHLEENAYRDDLHPLDLARKVEDAIRAGATVEEAERACRKDVTKLRFLLELPPKVQEQLKELPKERVPYTKLYELKELIGRVSEDDLFNWVNWVVEFNPSKEEIARRIKEAVEKPKLDLEATVKGMVAKGVSLGEAVKRLIGAGLSPSEADRAVKSFVERGEVLLVEGRLRLPEAREEAEAKLREHETEELRAKLEEAERRAKEERARLEEKVRSLEETLRAKGREVEELKTQLEEARARPSSEAEKLRRELEDRDRRIEELTRLLEEARAKAAEAAAAARVEDALALFKDASLKLADYAKQSPTAARRAVEAFEEAAERLLSHELLAVMDREKRDRVVNAMLRRAGVAKHDYCPICYGDLKRGDPVVVHRGCLEKAGFR